VFPRIVAALFLAGAPALAQDVRYYLFQEELEVGQLMQACSWSLSIPIDYDPGHLSGSISVDAPDGLSFEGLWALTNRRLMDRGLACVQLPGDEALSVVKADHAAGLARVEYGELSEAKAGFVKLIYWAEHTEPRQLATVVQTFLPERGTLVTALEGSTGILIAGLKPQAQEVLLLLNALDAGPEETAIEEIEVRHVSPTAMAAQLDQLAQKRVAAGGKKLVGSVVAQPETSSVLLVAPRSEVALWQQWAKRFDRADALLTHDYAPRHFGLAETASLIEEIVTKEGRTPPGWKLVSDALIGRLVITAPYGVHEEVASLLKRLDDTDTRARQELRSIAVSNRDVEELMGLLEGLIEGDSGVAEVLGGNASDAIDGQVPDPVRRAEYGLMPLAADKDTNRIVAFGPPHLLNQLEHLVATLDVAHPQVLVEVLVVSLSESELVDLGVELRGGDLTGKTQWELGSLFGLGSSDLAGSLVPPGGSGGSGVVLDPGSFSAVVRALEAVSDGRNSTIPKVLVSNHQDATLTSVLQTPYLSTSATSTVATTALGGTSDAGTNVTVTPHILDGDRLRLDYTVSISSFVGDSADPSLPPPRQENLLQSNVTLPDGFAIAVGGLDMESESEATSKIPVLGDLPVLGHLFRSTSVSLAKSRFFVFLRCNVIRGDGHRELLHISQEAGTAAGIGSDLPRLEPRIIR